MTEFTPYRFQKEDSIEAERFNGRCLVAWDPGLGKTPFSFYYADQFLDPDCKIVIVCPAGVKLQWEQEAKTKFGLRARILEGLSCPKDASLDSTRIIIANYEILTNHRDRRRRTWLSFLQKFAPDLVVIDEGQRIQSLRAACTKSVYILCARVPHVLILTGTPFTNQPAGLFSLIHLLRPDKFPAFFPFAWRFTRAKKSPWGWQFRGGKNLIKLGRMLKRWCMVRRRLRDVIKDLPKRSRHVIPVQISDRKEYDHAITDFLGWLREKDKARALRAEKAEAMVKATYILGLIGRLKTQAVRDWIDTFLEDSDGKLCVFGRHRAFLEGLHEAYPHSALITGKITGHKREAMKRKFIDAKRCRLLFGNMKAAGVGLDGLQHACSTMAHVEFSWVPGDHVQAEGRLDRIGQKYPVKSHWLVATNTIEEKLVAILQAKQEDFAQVFDGRKAKGSRLDVFDLLLKRLLRDGRK